MMSSFRSKEANHQTNRSRRIGLRVGNPSEDWRRAGTHRQTQKNSTWKFH